MLHSLIGTHAIVGIRTGSTVGIVDDVPVLVEAMWSGPAGEFVQVTPTGFLDFATRFRIGDLLQSGVPISQVVHIETSDGVVHRF